MKTTEEEVFYADTIAEALENLNVKPDAILMMLTLDDEGIGCHVQNPHMWPTKLKRTMCLALLSVLEEITKTIDAEEETVN